MDNVIAMGGDLLPALSCAAKQGKCLSCARAFIFALSLLMVCISQGLRLKMKTAVLAVFSR